MASVIFGGGVSEIRGSIAGQVFARNANGATIRNRTTPVNARTAKQVAVRNSFAGVANAWRDLTEEQRNGWVAAAPGFPYTNRLGQPSTYTGQQLFNTLNNSLVAIGSSVLVDAPTPSSTFGLVGSVTLDSGTAVANVSVPAGSDWAIQVFSSGPVSAGIMRPNSVRFQLVTNFGGALLVYDFFTEYTALFGAIVADQKVFFKFEAVNINSGVRIGVGTFSQVAA